MNLLDDGGEFPLAFCFQGVALPLLLLLSFDEFVLVEDIDGLVPRVASLFEDRKSLGVNNDLLLRGLDEREAPLVLFAQGDGHVLLHLELDGEALDAEPCLGNLSVENVLGLLCGDHL